MNEHCFAYADWLARSLPGQIKPLIAGADWYRLRIIADKCNHIRGLT